MIPHLENRNKYEISQFPQFARKSLDARGNKRIDKAEMQDVSQGGKIRIYIKYLIYTKQSGKEKIYHKMRKCKLYQGDYYTYDITNVGTKGGSKPIN